jgi:beta-mannosidase
MVLPWQLNESYPNAWRTSAVDYFGTPKPAYFAVARAFAPERVTVRVPTAVWAGEDAPHAQAWVWSEVGRAVGSRVLARLRSSDGSVLAEESWPVEGAVREPRPVGTLTVPARGVPTDAAIVWDVTWRSGDDQLIDRELMLAASGADFAPLLDLPPATIDVTASIDDGSPVLRIAHRTGPMVVGLQVLDDRATDAAGWVVPDGDPRPLLPGEARCFAVPGPAPSQSLPLLVEGWNITPLRVDARSQPSKETTR